MINPMGFVSIQAEVRILLGVRLYEGQWRRECEYRRGIQHGKMTRFDLV